MLRRDGSFTAIWDVEFNQFAVFHDRHPLSVPDGRH